MNPVIRKAIFKTKRKDSANTNKTFLKSKLISNSRLSTCDLSPFQFQTPCKNTPKGVDISPILLNKETIKKISKCNSQRTLKGHKKEFSEQYHMIRMKPINLNNQRLVLVPKKPFLLKTINNNKESKSVQTSQKKKKLNRVNSAKEIRRFPMISLYQQNSNIKHIVQASSMKKQNKSLSVKQYEDEKFRYTQLLFDENVELNKKKFKLESFINKFSDRNFVEALFKAKNGL